MVEGTRFAIAWAEQVWRRRVQDVGELSGGWTSTMLRLTADDGERAVLRLMTKQPWRTHAAGLIGRESEIQRQLAATDIPVPVSIAVDPTGADAGAPAHLMSWLPGAVELTRSDDDLLRSLARLLVEIHRYDPGPARPRDYQSWAGPGKRVVPDWSRDPEVWKEAFTVIERQPPPFRGTFLHRDFHLGNVLWDGGEATGVVDWVETSWGPRGLDVAHATTYLAMLHGAETANRFASIYHDLGDGAERAGDQRYWDVMDVVGYLPDACKVVQPWRDMGREIPHELARARLEEHLVSVMNR